MARPVLSGIWSWESSYSLRHLYVEQQLFFSDPQRVLCHEVPCWTSSDQYERVRAITPYLTHLLPMHTWDLVTLTSHMIITPNWAQFGHFHVGMYFCGQRFIICILFLPIFIYILLCYVSFLFVFFCTVHWADLSWFTFHYWLYPV